MLRYLRVIDIILLRVIFAVDRRKVNVVCWPGSARAENRKIRLSGVGARI